MGKSKVKKGKRDKKQAAAAAVEPLSPKIEKKSKKKRKTKRPKLESSDSEADLDPQTKLQTLLEPFTKDQLVNLLIDLSLSENSLYTLVKSTADQDISHRKIFVHGLGWDASKGLVESVFRAYGEMENLNVVMDRNTGKCKGYAFITYKTRKAANKVLKNPKIKVGNRTTSCQLASEGPPGPATAGIVSQQHFTADYPQRKIYVNNVPSNASADKLRNFFEKFGEIETGPKGFDPVTGKSKGYALFVYKTLEGAKKALEEPYKMFESNQLHCRRANEGKNDKVASGAASITTALQPVQPQMLAAVAAAQQAQNMAMLGQQAAGFMNPMFGGEMGANLGALMGGYYGMFGAPMPGYGLGAYGASGATVEGGSSKTMLQGLPYMYPNMQSGHTSSSLANTGKDNGGGYSPTSI